MDRYFKAALAAFPTAAGLTYLIGVIYDSSYFRHWGLDSDEFPRSFNDTLVRGVLALLEIGSVHLPILVSVSMLLLIAVVLLNVGLEKRAKRIAESVEPNGNLLEGKKVRYAIPEWATVLGFIAGIFAFLTSGFFVLTLAIALLGVFVSAAGKNVAQRREAEITKVSWSEVSPHDVQIKSIEIELDNIPRRLVTCVPDKCVFLTVHGVESIDRRFIAVMKTRVKEN